MKKIVLLILIILIVPIVIIEDADKDYKYYNNNYPDIPKDEKWEYVKNRIAITHFIGVDKKYDFKYTGPILFNLNNATKKDSLAVNEVINKFKEVLPNKEIGYFKDYTGYDYDIKKLFPWNKGVLDSIKGYYIRDLVNRTIQFNFEEHNDTLISSSDKRKFVNLEEHGLMFEFGYITSDNKIKGLFGYHRPNILFSFSNDSSIEERKKEIKKYSILLIGALASKVDGYETVINSKLHRSHRGLYSENYKESDLDWFLIQKLYSKNLYKEFKSYLYQTYPWNYASNYLNKEKTKIFATWFSVVFGVIMFLLGFSLLYNYKQSLELPILNYFIPILFTVTGCMYVYYIYTYITIPFEFISFGDFVATFIVLLVISLITALFLMVFDIILNKNNLHFTIEVVLKVAFTFLIGIVPIVIVFLTQNKYEFLFELNLHFLIIFGLSICRGLILYLNHFSQNLVKQKDIELSHLKALNSEAEVKLLQSQINPHFLYNSLNSIASLAQKDGVKTEKMALSLSDLFKYTINRKGKKQSTIGDEVEMVRNYLEVEQIRFGDRLNFKIKVDESLEVIEIPMFIIQPLIENAVKHGISKIEGQGYIELIIEKEENNIFIKIKDNGVSFPDGLVSGHGMQTVHDLLRLSYGEKASINIENHPEKVVTIKIKGSV